MRKKATFLAFVILSLFFIQVISLLFHHSLTNDETAHTAAGLLYLQSGDFSGGVHNPPLLQVAFGLPYALGVGKIDLFADDPPLAGRAMNIFFALSLLAVMTIYCHARFGIRSALLAAFLFVTSPSLIAHSTITTTDIGVTLFSFASMVTLWWAHEQKSHWAIILPASLLGIALSSKFTALVFLTSALLLVFSAGWTKAYSFSRMLKECAMILAICWLIFSASYSFVGSFEMKSSHSFLSRLLTYPLPFQAVKGFETKFRLSQQSFPLAFYLSWKGKVARWLYYPTITFVKEPLGTVFILLFFFGTLITKRLHPEKEDLYLILPGGIYFMTLCFNSFHDGFRHTFPFFVLLLIATASVARLAKESRPVAHFLLFCLFLNIVSLVNVHPHQMSYFNVLGSWLSKEPFVASGADTDYGQDDLALREELLLIEKDISIYLNPQPAQQPRVGVIALNCATYEKYVDNNLDDYSWLLLFRPYHRIGDSWILFRIKEDDYINLPWPKGKVWFDYLLYNGQYERLIREVKERSKIVPELLLYELKALIYLGRYEEGIATLESYSKEGNVFARQAKRWLYLCRELAGKGRGDKASQLCRAILSLRELDEVGSRHLRARLAKSDVLKSITGPYPNRDVTMWKGLHLFDDARFREALPWMRALGKDEKLTAELVEKRNLCTLAVHTLDNPKKKQRLRLVFDRRFAAHAPRFCTRIVGELKTENEKDYNVIMASQWLWGWQRRGQLTVDLERGSIFDDIDEPSQKLVWSSKKDGTVNAGLSQR